MKYLMLVCEDPEAEPYDPAQDHIQDWVKEYDAKGWHLDGQRLRPKDQASTVKVRGGKTLVVDGPFAETKEGIAGFDLLECPHLDAAIEVASKHPMARFGRIELRPFRALDLPGVAAPGPVPAGSELYFQFLVNEPGSAAATPDFTPVVAWINKHSASGVFRSGERLAGAESATTVRLRQNRILVTDGPFAETKEILGGYGILACRSKAEAVQVSAEHPVAKFGSVEVRAFWPFG